MPIRATTKTMILGFLVGGSFIAYGVLDALADRNQLNEVTNRCNREADEAKARGSRFRLTCDSRALSELGTSVGVQAEIVAAQRKVNNPIAWPYVVGGTIAGLLAIPWLWYFLLERIRELREAMAGR